MRIKRDDKDGRQDWVLRGFRRFDAPVSVVVRDHTQLPDDQAIKICVAMGWPDEVFPPTRSSRSARTLTRSPVSSASSLNPYSRNAVSLSRVIGVNR